MSVAPFFKAAAKGAGKLVKPMKGKRGYAIAGAEGVLGLGGFFGEELIRGGQRVTDLKQARTALGFLESRAKHTSWEAQKLLKQVERNTQKIMEMKPELAQQLLAGRRLPRGAVVIGGEPRTDILEQVAMRMAQNSPMEGTLPMNELPF